MEHCRLYHCLDITLREAQSQVRNPTAARLLGTICRVVVNLANAAVDPARRVIPKPDTTPAASNHDTAPPTAAVNAATPR